MKHIITLCLALVALCSATAAPKPFVKVLDGRLLRDGAPYYYIGTNYWYGPILASDGAGGNIERLRTELDSLKALGIDNLRVLAGAEAGSPNANSVHPYLQPEPGQLNDTLLVGLDRFIAELDKRDMLCVIYLTNAWDWSGGYGFYLNNVGLGASPSADGEGYQDYVNYAAQFVESDKAQQLFFDYVRKLLARRNSVTGRLYTEEPAIMAWQVANEPRAFSRKGLPKLKTFIDKTAAIIKEMDTNHLVSVGSEGSVGCENDLSVYEQIHQNPDIDYLTIHIWPANWQWCVTPRLWDDLPFVYQKTTQYIETHQRLAKKLYKPLVIEEFGYPREKKAFEPGSPAFSRNAFYRYVFERVVMSAKSHGFLSGCNFWGWGGEGRPANERWSPGDDFICDPPHEPQGWYSVFSCDDETIDVIRTATTKLSAPNDEEQ